jgi:4-oxalocrotonate tautomerase
MPIIHVTTWAGQRDDKSRELVEALTVATHSVTGAPLDKITVYITEIPRSRWAEAGCLGSDPDFSVVSRRQAYDVQSDTAE